MATIPDNNTLWLLTLVNMALLVAYVTRHCVTRRGIEFNHITTISLGYFMYWILPFLIGLLRLFSDNPVCHVWYTFYDSVPFSTKVLYLWFCLFTYGAFILGTELCTRMEAGLPKPVYRAINFPFVYLKAQLLLCMLLVCYTTYLVRQDLFHGYTTIGGDGDVRRSVFISSSGLLEALAFLYCMKWEERLRTQAGIEKPTFGQVIFNRAMIAYGIISVLVVSTGHRLSALSSILMLLIYCTVYFKRIRFRATLLVVGASLGAMGAVGLARGSNALSTDGVLFQLIMEPVGASQTLLAFLKAGRLELLNYPMYLINGFFNLIPRPLFPDKATLLIKPASQGYVIYAPGGSFHNFVQCCINFGLIGTVGVWFLLGYGMQKLKLADKSMLHRTSYIMISGFLLTTFFRDDFSGSIVKAIVQISILIPMFTAISANVLRNYMYPPAPVSLPVAAPEGQAN